MNLFLESIGIALAAIWSNKLRSFLTVLGNIVAVTSIIAVVSLIQGLNGKVTEAITSELGVDSFQVQRRPMTMSQDDEDRARSNPRVTLDDMAAIRRYSTLARSIMATDDITPRGIQRAGGQIELYGAPVEPGNLLLLAYRDGKPIIGAPGCIKSRETNVVDLILPPLLAGDRVTRGDVIAFAEGGLLV